MLPSLCRTFFHFLLLVISQALSKYQWSVTPEFTKHQDSYMGPPLYAVMDVSWHHQSLLHTPEQPYFLTQTLRLLSWCQCIFFCVTGAVGILTALFGIGFSRVLSHNKRRFKWWPWWSSWLVRCQSPNFLRASRHPLLVYVSMPSLPWDTPLFYCL